MIRHKDFNNWNPKIRSQHTKGRMITSTVNWAYWNFHLNPLHTIVASNWCPPTPVTDKEEITYSLNSTNLAIFESKKL